jgi:hypothetical protein
LKVDLAGSSRITGSSGDVQDREVRRGCRSDQGSGKKSLLESVADLAAIR